MNWPTRAAPTWDEVVFVCGKCMRRNESGEPLSLRKWLKLELKSRDLHKRIRVVESGCLDLCPKRGVVLARGAELGGDRKKLRVHRNGDDRQQLIEWLTSEPLR